MRYRLVAWARLLVFAAVASLAGGARQAAAEITPGQPLRVRVLYDHSGSMYPGYRPPGTPGRRVRSDLHVQYFHEYPAFQQWLADFVALQTLLDGGTVGMWTFASAAQFSPSDIQAVHPEVPIDRFDIAQAVRRFAPHAGLTTYLSESLDTFSRDFEGLVWLITDNIVETRAGEPNSDVERFFRALNETARYRSVHLFKYPFRDDAAGQESALAIYGILVSQQEIPDTTLAYYDRKFRTNVRAANRPQGAALFPGQEHLKLKNLRVDALELRAIPNLDVILENPSRGMFKEGQNVRLSLSGEIKSYLTQHSVTSGSYHLVPAGPFQPEDWARRDLGIESLPPDFLQSASGSITEPIPPNGVREVKTTVRSTRPLVLKPKGLVAWFRAAFNGARVRFTGAVRMSFQDVAVQLERSQMAGIFGIDRASGIFDFQDVSRLDQISPTEARVSFALESGYGRTVTLLFIIGLLAAILAIVLLLLSRRQWYWVRISGTEPKLVPLRRLGSYNVVYEKQPLGRLIRKMSDYEFVPTPSTAAFSIVPGRAADTWDVRFRDGKGCQLSIEPKSGRKHAQADAVKPGDPTPKRPMAVTAPTGPEPGRPRPKIDRPR